MAQDRDPGTALLQQVRDACRTVALRSTYVRIDEERIPAYAASLPLEQIARPEHHPERHYLGHGEDTVAFFLTLDAINFGSGYFPHLRKRPGMSGYFTVAASLTDHYRTHGPLPAPELAAIDVQRCTHIFGQDPGNATIQELMQLFAIALNDLGRYLLEGYGGRFVGPVQAAGHSAERLVELLIEMPLFNDVSSYHGLRVPFFKRAQLTAADLAIAFHEQGPGRFHDLDLLTIFADNLVPHVLRVDGILVYQEDLLARINCEELIPAGSPQEVEIRACALHAVERMSQELHRMGHHVSPMELDYLLWNRGQGPHYKRDRPRHRTRTTFY
jgi:hypothetical protein